VGIWIKTILEIIEKAKDTSMDNGSEQVAKLMKEKNKLKSPKKEYFSTEQLTGLIKQNSQIEAFREM